MLAPLLLWLIYSLPIGEFGTEHDKNFPEILINNSYVPQTLGTTNFSIMG